MGGAGGIVEVDETFIGRLRGVPKGKKGFHHKMKVPAPVDRKTGRSRSMVIDRANAFSPAYHADKIRTRAPRAAASERMG